MEQSVDPRVVEACLRVEARLPELADIITTDLRAREHVYATLPRPELAAAALANIAGIVEGVRLNRVQTLDAPGRTGRRRAEQGIPLPTVLSGYRLGVMHVWRRLVDTCAAIDRESGDPTGGASRALLDSAAVLWTAFDEHAQELSAEYRAYEAETLERDQARRDALLAAVFSGESVGELSVVEIAQRLRLPRTGPFAVVVSDPGVLAAQGAGSRRAAELFGVPCAWRTGAHTDTGLVSLQATDGLARLRERLPGLALGRVGLSRTVPTLDEVPSAVAQAQRARAAAPAGDQIVVSIDEVWVGDLLLSAAERARTLEETVLSGMAQLPADEQRTLLTTLAAWFAHGGAAEPAARQLHCHPNTVRYRLTKLAGLTGRSLKDPVDTVHLYLAMEARRLHR